MKMEKTEAEIRQTKIKEVFETMSYSNNTDDCVGYIKSQKWFQSNRILTCNNKPGELQNGIPIDIRSCVNNEVLTTIYEPDIDTIKLLLKDAEAFDRWNKEDASKRTSKLISLAKEIEDNAQILAEIEMHSRGVLFKDVLKVINIFSQYFFYYSNYCVKAKNVPTSDSMVAAVIDDSNTILPIAMVLAPALAAGNNVVLHTGIKLSLPAFYIVSLAEKVGIPKGTVRVIPIKVVNWNVFSDVMSPQQTLAVFGNIHEGKKFYGNSLWLHSFKTPMLVFENADLDSAAQAVVDAAWNYNSMLPWSVGTVLVQENVFQSFAKKLKRILSKVRVGKPYDPSADVCFSPEALEKASRAILDAKKKGIDIYQPFESSLPVVFCGRKVYHNNVLDSENTDDCTVTLLPFRTIYEAVNLANNTGQGLGASVWSENVGLINEVSRKIKVSNVWVNSHGLISVDTPISPIKASGVGYFGGKEGFYEYNKSSAIYYYSAFPKSVVGDHIKIQENWYKKPSNEKIRLLQEVAEMLRLNDEVSGANCIYEVIADIDKQCNSATKDGFNLTSLRVPHGAVSIYGNNCCSNKILWSALFQGNTVCLYDTCQNKNSIHERITKLFPQNVFTTQTPGITVKKYFDHMLRKGYSSVVTLERVSLGVQKNISSIDAVNIVTYTKNIWTDIGQSSQCSL